MSNSLPHNPVVNQLRVAAKTMQECEIPVCRFGIFGSAVHDPTVNDVDVLLTLSLHNGDQGDFGDVLRSAIDRMEGDYSKQAPVNNASKKFVTTCVDAIQIATSLPLVFGLGPSNKHNYKGRWIHLNGPMSDEVWALFTREYPIHGLLIRNNYLPILGDPPVASPFNGDILLKYCSDMIRRDRSMPTLKTADKLVRVLALLAGESRALRSAAVDTVYGWNAPIARALHEFFATKADSDASVVTLALIEAVSSIAHLMNAFRMEYPRDWGVE